MAWVPGAPRHPGYPGPRGYPPPGRAVPPAGLLLPLPDQAPAPELPSRIPPERVWEVEQSREIGVLLDSKSVSKISSKLSRAPNSISGRVPNGFEIVNANVKNLFERFRTERAAPRKETSSHPRLRLSEPAGWEAASRMRALQLAPAWVWPVQLNAPPGPLDLRATGQSLGAFASQLRKNSLPFHTLKQR